MICKHCGTHIFEAGEQATPTASAKVTACSYSHRHGTDCLLGVAPSDWDSTKIIKAETQELIAEYGKAEIEDEEARYGGVDYCQSWESGSVRQGLDGKQYRITIEEV